MSSLQEGRTGSLAHLYLWVDADQGVSLGIELLFEGDDYHLKLSLRLLFDVTCYLGGRKKHTFISKEGFISRDSDPAALPISGDRTYLPPW